jgi:O-methyltransferase
VNWTVYEDSRIARLPRLLQWPALLARNAGAGPERVRYVYEADGMATAHYSPCIEDRDFAARYDEMAQTWYTGVVTDARWRAWILTATARSCRSLAGDYVEFGTYRGGYAYMLLSSDGLGDGQTLHLFDTFSGTPASSATEAESRQGLTERHADTSPEHVTERLAAWRDRIHLWPGDVFDTIPAPEIGPLAFVHMDLNASAPTAHALAWAWPRLVDGGTMVFDDYGDENFADQRREIDAFFAQRGEMAIALPTGQAIAIKRPAAPGG